MVNQLTAWETESILSYAKQLFRSVKKGRGEN